MAITQAMTNSFKVDILSGGMNFNSTNRALSSNTQDTFKIALYTASTASLDATTTLIRPRVRLLLVAAIRRALEKQQRVVQVLDVQLIY
jgi:spore coat protein CotF